MPTLIAIAVVENRDCFLIGQRPQGVPLEGLWEFPGGKVEPDETAEFAAVRECREETSLDVRVVGEYPQHVQQYDHDRVQLRFFRCEPVDAQATPAAPYRWVARLELGKYDFPEGNRGLLAALCSRPNAG
jgi:mutator protein MutT